MKTIVRMVDVPINDWNNQTKGIVTLEVSDGEFVLLRGPNGSGKSYLLNLMAALRVPRVGEVFLEGKRLTKMREGQKRAWRAGLGLIPSEPVLLNGYTVLEGLVLTAQLLGKNAADAQRNALESASLCGLDPYLNARAESLSVGVKKRVVIARSLVNQPRLDSCGLSAGGTGRSGTGGISLHLHQTQPSRLSDCDDLKLPASV